jgi:EpsI family protein
MARKPFIAFLSAIILTSLFGFAVRHYQPAASARPKIGEFPLQMGGWRGVRDDVIPDIVEMLNPTEIFSATYANDSGAEVHLFFDYFASQSSPGGPHSPRNCMPGSGWTILKVEDREISVKGRAVRIGRFDLRMAGTKKVMDFWYITRYGETANDYMFKMYLMISSLTFRPNDIAFIRVISSGDEEGLKALDEFERLFVEEIYRYLGFD